MITMLVISEYVYYSCFCYKSSLEARLSSVNKPAATSVQGLFLKNVSVQEEKAVPRRQKGSLAKNPDLLIETSLVI